MDDILDFLQELYPSVRSEVVESLAAYLSLVIALEDWRGTRLSPPPTVRALWVAFVANTEEYAVFCEQYADGNTIRHRPESVAEPEEAQRYLKTYLLASDMVDSFLCWPVPPELVLAPATPKKKRSRLDAGYCEVAVRCSKTLQAREFTLIGGIKRAACKRMGIAMDDERTRLYAGDRELKDDATMAECGLGDAQLELVFLK